MPKNRNWRQPATTWQGVIQRYAAYLETPRWRGKALNADGSDAAERYSPKQSARVQAGLLGTVEPLIASDVLSSTVKATDIRLVAAHIGYSGRRFNDCPKRLWHLWRAIIFNRDCYTCRYCGRSTWDVEAEQGRGLRFELDHAKPRAKLGEDCDDFDARNIVTACRSCNVIKGQMDATRFKRELRSLARAVIRKYHLS